MSFDDAITAIRNDPELAKELNAATTPNQRAAILQDRGIALPHGESDLSVFDDVVGGQASSPVSTTAATAATSSSQ